MTNPPPASDGMVVYDNVSKFFPVRIRPGQKDRPELMVALDRINATVRKGELITLLGPSGCGKTTLLRLTAGLLAADEGAITIAGAPVAAPRKDACMVFQNFGLLPWRTVLSNVEFPLEIDGVGASERRDIARHFIELVGLSAFTEHFPHELSGGMQQRVGIARAFSVEPDLLLMDEPFSHLDAITARSLREELQAIWEATRRTVLFVTHDVLEAVQLSNRIIIVAYGGRNFADLTIDLPYPRLQADPAVATMQAEILKVFEEMERRRRELDPRIAELAASSKDLPAREP